MILSWLLYQWLAHYTYNGLHITADGLEFGADRRTLRSSADTTLSGNCEFRVLHLHVAEVGIISQPTSVLASLNYDISRSWSPASSSQHWRLPSCCFYKRLGFLKLPSTQGFLLWRLEVTSSFAHVRQMVLNFSSTCVFLSVKMFL
jgi:hypothetical protein